jgi:hypothetical protein
MRADDQDRSAPAPARVMRVAEKAFLGPEFLTWLYFTLRDNGFALDVGDALPPDQRPVDNVVQFAVGKRVSLSDGVGGAAKVTITGTGLDESGELLQAVRRGAWIDSIALDVAISQRVYSLRLRADDGSISGLKLPDLFSEAEDESNVVLDPLEKKKAKRRPKLPLDEVLSLRMQCVEEVEMVIDALYQRFLTRRLARAWLAEDLMSMSTAISQGLKARLPDESGKRAPRPTTDAD